MQKRTPIKVIILYLGDSIVVQNGMNIIYSVLSGKSNIMSMTNCTIYVKFFLIHVQE